MKIEITEEMRLAFYAHIETTRLGTILNLDEGIRAAIEKGLESGAIPSHSEQSGQPFDPFVEVV